MDITSILLALNATVAPILGAASTPEPTPPPDPTVVRLVNCHGDYAIRHANSQATPTEVSVAAMSACSKEMEAAAESTYQKSLQLGSPLDIARETRSKFVEEMRNFLPGFVIGLVIEHRDKGSDAGG